jgi:hypothetical protein
MTAREAVSNFRNFSLSRDDERFLYLATHAHELTLANGCRLIDGTDFIQFFREMAEALEFYDVRDRAAKRMNGAVPAQPRWNSIAKAGSDPCHRCGHVHEGSKECGVLIGGDRICRCEMEVTA